MNNYQFTYPAEWEKPPWERRGCDPVRQAYVEWFQRYHWDLFVSVNFRQKQVSLKQKNHQKTGRYLRNVIFAPWGSVSDVESRLKAMDARVCKDLLGRHWASQWNERPEWVGFMEKDEEGFAHAHLLVNLKSIEQQKFITTFSLATRYFAPQADIRPEGAFKEIYSAAGAIYYSTKYHKNPKKECAVIASPTFLKNVSDKQGPATEVDD